MNQIEHLINPTRAQIFFEIVKNEQSTAKKLLEKFPEISQPTLYRHLKAMLDGGIIMVAGERRIRGVVEKSYSINNTWTADVERIVTENDGEGYMQLFLQYITGVISEYRSYCESANLDIINDGTGFSTAPIYATTAELHEAMIKINEIIMPLVQNEKTPERELRNLCTIITPPKK